MDSEGKYRVPDRGLEGIPVMVVPPHLPGGNRRQAIVSFLLSTPWSAQTRRSWR